jgi:hypothetical membrane protein
MTTTPRRPAQLPHAPSPRRPERTTRRLLLAAAVAGPLYVLVALGQALVRDGFDLRHHAVSLLATGDWGWVQSANFLVTGGLTIAGAAGIRRALRSGPGHRWGPRLLGLYGASLLAAGVFPADPAAGFPAGTPTGPPAVISWHGTLHLVAGGIGFLALVAACLVLARRFATRARPGWAAASSATGMLVLVAFAVIASGQHSVAVTLGFGAAVVLAWAWVTALAVCLAGALEPTSGEPRRTL